MTISAAILYALASGAIQTAPLTQDQATVSTTQDDDESEQVIPSGVASSDAYDLGEIVVSSARPRGSVDGDIEPDIVLSAEQLQAYGASNIEELLTALEPLTRSSRGRSSSGPVVLINGRRTSGMQEFRSIPFEAIERTEILPEEVALTYGYSADQRVVNIVLKAQFRQGTAEANLRGPSQGGRTSTEVEGNFFRIQDGDRWNLQIEHQHDTALWESERNIDRSGSSSQPFDLIGNVSGSPYGAEIDPALSVLAGAQTLLAAVPTGTTTPTLADFAAGAGTVRTGNLSDYRTLLPRGDDSTLEASLSRDLNSTTKATVSLSLEDESSASYQGLPGLTLALPATNPYSPFSNDTLLYRYADAPGALLRENDTLTGKAGLLLDGFVGDWRWTLSGAYDRVETDTTTGRGYDATALQAALTAGNPAVNPFAALPTDLLSPLTDTAHSVSSGGNAEVVLAGRPWSAPAGDLQTTFKVGLDTRSLESESVRSGVSTDRSLQRDRGYGTASFTLPLTSRDREVFGAIGDLSVNFNAGYDEVSDFGGLTTLGLGANWTPITPLSFIVSYTDEDGAPTIQQLNDPILATPNVPVYDFRTGQTVLINQTSGGNPNLGADSRQVLKLGLNLQPWSARDLSFSSNYTWSRINDAITAFPTITADLEAALPGRFNRDDAGNLISIDARPLNFDRTERQDIRTGFNYSRAFGKPTPQAARGGAPGMPGGPRPGGGAGGPGGGRPGGGGMMITSGGPGGGGGGRGGRGGNMQPGQGRFNLSIYHTYRIQDEIVIRDGLPVLDLLDGAATGANGGQPRNEIELQAGVFRSGFGAFLNASWKESTFVDGGVGGTDLFFGDQSTVNLNVFADLSQRTKWVEKFPWLKGARVNLGVQNLFDARQDVRTSSGDLPLNYQPDFLDPQGRVVRISLRKILF